jgi:hypothetical protein
MPILSFPDEAITTTVAQRPVEALEAAGVERMYGLVGDPLNGIISRADAGHACKDCDGASEGIQHLDDEGGA